MKSPSRPVPIKTKGLRKKLLSVAEQSIESQHFRDRKIVLEAIRFHTKLAAQLFHSKRTASLISFDSVAHRTESIGPIQSSTLKELERLCDDINGTLNDTFSVIENLRMQTGPLEIVSNESESPLICPTEPLRNRAAFTLHSNLSQSLNILNLLLRFDAAVREALALRQFGFFSQEVWQSTIFKATKQFRKLFTHKL